MDRNKRSSWTRICIGAISLTLASRCLPAVAMDLEYAAKVRERVAAHDPVYAPAMDRLVAAADKAMKEGPWTVTDKKVLAPSKNPNDYVSLAPYFWPDPTKPDGLPYISRDGEVNPGSRLPENSDRNRLESLFTTVRTLGVAAYMTGNPEYAKHAADLLRVFFLDKKTGMNPNLNYAQGVPGKFEGRSYGVIDFNSFPETLDGIRLFEKAAGPDIWTESDRQGFRDWCSQFLIWLQTSKNGLEESHAANNHGAWYDATSSSLADFLGMTEQVKHLAEQSEKRIGKQIKTDGTLPLELSRTRSWHYTIFALTAYAITTEHARRNGFDLWHYQPEQPSAGDLSKAVSCLLHYTETDAPWVKKDIDKPENPTLFYLQVRSILDETKDADLCRRLDAILAQDGQAFQSSMEMLTVGRLQK